MVDGMGTTLRLAAGFGALEGAVLRAISRWPRLCPEVNVAWLAPCYNHASKALILLGNFVFLHVERVITNDVLYQLS
jgi:hypothetical protein